MTFLALTFGGYGTDTVSALAFIVWGLILVGLGFGILPRAQLPRPAWIVIGLMVALTAWAAIAISWSDDAGLAYIRTIQIATATGILAAVILFSKRGEGMAWIQGLTIGFAVIVYLAAASRFFPGIGNDAELTLELGNIIGGRLSWPIGYWNGLGVATACLIVLCVWQSAHSPSRFYRLAATATLPVASVVMYLCSSRGSLVALACGLAVIVFLGPNRRLLVGTFLIGVAGAVPLILLADNLYELVHAGTGSKATFQGLLMLAATAAVSAISCRLRSPILERMQQLDLDHKTTIRISAVVAGIILILAISADPVQRVSSFTTVPVTGIESSEDSAFATEHLLSESGNGRWQLWESALDAFGTEPVRGIGSGGFEAWFKTNGSFWMKTVDPHSMPLHYLSELGLVGLTLLVGSFGYAVFTGARRYRELGRDLNAPEDDVARRPEIAAFLGLLAIGAFAFSIDWTGEIPVLFAPMMLAIAALAGPLYATRVKATAPSAESSPGARYLRYGVTGVAMLICGAVLIATARQYEATRNIAESRTAFEAGDGQKALEHAERAISATPWAGAAYAQLAAVQEKVDGGGAAVASVMEATARSPKNDSYWILQSDIQKRLGLEDAAILSALTAQSLNPNSLYWLSDPPANQP